MPTLNGTSGNDNLIQPSNGLSGFIINGFAGDDTIQLLRNDDFGGDNTVDAGEGNDTVFNTFEGGNLVTLGAGNDTYIGTGFASFSSFDTVLAGAGNDKIAVSTFFSEYFGEAGNDTFVSVGWENVFNGGAGIDTVDYRARSQDSVLGGTGVNIELDTGLARTGAIRTETLISIESAIGTELADDIFGSAVNNRLSGAGGNDRIAGLDGNDVLTGGRGNDQLEGGVGHDTFVFDIAASNAHADVIFDFSVADDTMKLKKSLFINMGPAVEAGEFRIGAAAADANDHLIYNSANGRLFFDADGDGGVAARLFATLTTGLALTSADFVLF